MLTENGKHLYVSHERYHHLIEKLALMVYESGWQFDTILCLARGGVRPGDILSRIFNLPLAIMSTSSYRDDHGTKQGHLDIAHYITTPKGQIAGRVLLVDDLADSGKTLHEVVQMLRGTGATTILVTHDPVEAFATSDRVAVMLSGTIRQCASPSRSRSEVITPASAGSTIST